MIGYYLSFSFQGGIMEALNAIVSEINGFLWSSVIIILLVGAGFYFTVRTRGVQIRYFTKMFSLITESAGKKTAGNEISPFQAFCVSTASRVGVGNIAGIAIAITAGGPGAIFWMWFIAIIGSATGFVESTLGQIYKVPREDGTGFRGGPAYYLKNGLGHGLWAAIFAILISVTYGMIYNSVQSNTIALALSSSLGLDRMLIGGVVTVLAMAVICGGMGRIARVTEWMVPIMAGIYILITLGIMLFNITEMPRVFGIIFRDAFDFQAVFGGGMGAAVLTGFKRGLFSNEAGEGSVPNAAATADASHPSHPVLRRLCRYALHLLCFRIHRPPDRRLYFDRSHRHRAHPVGSCPVLWSDGSESRLHPDLPLRLHLPHR